MTQLSRNPGVDAQRSGSEGCADHIAQLSWSEGFGVIKDAIALKILWSDASVLCDTRKHSGTNFLAVVKSEDNVEPSFA